MNYRPTWNLASVPDDLLKAERARRNSARRKTFAGGPGRPRSAERCACGQMTQARAIQRKHVCAPPVFPIERARAIADETIRHHQKGGPELIAR